MRGCTPFSISTSLGRPANRRRVDGSIDSADLPAPDRGTDVWDSAHVHHLSEAALRLQAQIVPTWDPNILYDAWIVVSDTDLAAFIPDLWLRHDWPELVLGVDALAVDVPSCRFPPASPVPDSPDGPRCRVPGGDGSPLARHGRARKRRRGTPVRRPPSPGRHSPPLPSRSAGHWAANRPAGLRLGSQRDPRRPAARRRRRAGQPSAAAGPAGTPASNRQVSNPLSHRGSNSATCPYRAVISRRDMPFKCR
jgi:hypothetical protein